MKGLKDEIESVMKEALKAVSIALKEEYVLDKEGAIEFEFSMIVSNSVGGNMNIKLAKADGKTSKEKIHRIKFTIKKMTEMDRLRVGIFKKAHSDITGKK